MQNQEVEQEPQTPEQADLMQYLAGLAKEESAGEPEPTRYMVAQKYGLIRPNLLHKELRVISKERRQRAKYVRS